MKHKIPTHDPQTGELNPYYEELTGEPNPLATRNKIPSTFNLDQLIGKKFRYLSDYGLSNWSDTVMAIIPKQGIHTNFFKSDLSPRVDDNKPQKPFQILGYTYELFVVAFKTGQHYEFNQCIFLEDER